MKRSPVQYLTKTWWALYLRRMLQYYTVGRRGRTHSLGFHIGSLDWNCPNSVVAGQDLLLPRDEFARPKQSLWLTHSPPPSRLKTQMVLPPEEDAGRM